MSSSWEQTYSMFKDKELIDLRTLIISSTELINRLDIICYEEPIINKSLIYYPLEATLEGNYPLLVSTKSVRVVEESLDKTCNNIMRILLPYACIDISNTSAFNLALILSIFREYGLSHLALAKGIKKYLEDPTPNPLTEKSLTPLSTGLSIDDFAGSEDYSSGKELEYVNLMKPIDRKIIGRDSEISRANIILKRKEKANVMLIGEAGVGKTAIVKGLVALGLTIHELDTTQITAGTKYRGELEERIMNTIESIKGTTDILFIDEIHTSTASTTSGATSIIDMIKPYLTEGNLRVIGATTKDEYYKYLVDDKAICRRLQNIFVEELCRDKVLEILEGNLHSYEIHHKVFCDISLLDYIYDTSSRYLNYSNQPDISFDLLDEAMVRAKKTKEVTKDIIKETISAMVNIPTEYINKSFEDSIKDLELDFKENIIGQDHILKPITEQLLFSGTTLAEEANTVASFLFTGHTGVGKTEVSKVIALSLGMQFLRIDMSEYSESHSVAKLIGSPAGYVGYDDAGVLVDKLRYNPHTLVLFDEIDKAHPDVANILLSMLDRGVVTDSKGNAIDCTNTIVIGTCNTGAVYRSSIGFNSQDMHVDDEAIENKFSAELRNRFDAILKFNVIDKDNARLIAKKILSTDISNKDLDSILDYGTIRKNGAREIKRMIKKFKIKELVEC